MQGLQGLAPFQTGALGTGIFRQLPPEQRRGLPQTAVQQLPCQFGGLPLLFRPGARQTLAFGAGRLGIGPGLVSGSFGLVQLLFVRDPVRQGHGARMLHGTADGTGLPGHQPLGQHARLGVQIQVLQMFKALLGLMPQLLGFQIGLPCRLQGALSLVQLGQCIGQTVQSPFAVLQLLQRLPLPDQALGHLGSLLQEPLSPLERLLGFLQLFFQAFPIAFRRQQRFFIPGLLLSQTVQSPVPGLQGLQCGDLIRQRRPLGLPLLLVLPCFLRRLQRSAPGGDGLLSGGKLLPQLPLPPGGGQPGAEDLILFLQLPDLPNQGLDLLRILLQQFRQQIPCLGRLQMLGHFLRTVDFADLRPDAAAQGGAGIGHPVALLHQLVLEPLEPLRAEELLEDGLFLVAVRQQQPLEIPLGQHGDAGKLVLVHAQDLHDLVIDLLGAGDDLAVRHGQGCLDRGLGLALGAGPPVARHPADGVALSPAAEFQLHEGLRLGLGILGAEELAVVLAAADVSLLAAGAAVEGEADGIEEHGLTGTRVAGDQVKAPVPQGLEVQHRLPGVGTEGGNGQFQWSHASSSQIDSMSFARNASCCRLMG